MEQLTDRDFYPEWHEALDLLNRDLAATTRDVEPFALLLNEWGVQVGFPSWGWQGMALPEDAGLFHVADAAQESAMEYLWRVWPVCPEHSDMGLHARFRPEDGSTVWSCRSGHDYPVGTLEARQLGSRRASKRRIRKKRVR